MDRADVGCRLGRRADGETMTDQEPKIKSEAEMYEQNRELGTHLNVESLAIGSKFWHSLYREIWTVTAIRLKFTDQYNGAPKVAVELHDGKKPHRYEFPSAHAVYNFSYLKELVGKT
jgi:hypothetical protein